MSHPPSLGQTASEYHPRVSCHLRRANTVVQSEPNVTTQLSDLISRFTLDLKKSSGPSELKVALIEPHTNSPSGEPCCGDSSPDVVAVGFVGDLTFNSLTDTPTWSDVEPFKFASQSGFELPPRGS
ncbi:hypothetical protein BDV93DRAFT_545423 [Ceratobasidium sp. AG-I]|nr:hypothetical protein BDV93DRAFT_545423 [Ceratobasidium sp. AG-I]